MDADLCLKLADELSHLTYMSSSNLFAVLPSLLQILRNVRGPVSEAG